MPTITSPPYTISSPGVYQPTADLSCNLSSGAAITVSANDVTIDLAGFTLTNTNGPLTSAIGISGGGTNVEVLNGKLSGFHYGVELSGVRLEAEELDVIQSWYRGIRLLGTSATARRCIIRSCGGAAIEGDYRIAVGIENNATWGLTEDCQVYDVFGRDTSVGPAESVGISHGGTGGGIRRNIILSPSLRAHSWATWISNPDRVLAERNYLVNWENGLPEPTGSSVAAGSNDFINVTNAMLAGIDDLGGNRSMSLPFFLGLAPSEPSGTVVFEAPLNTLSDGNDGSTFIGITSAIQTAGAQVRVTWKAPPSIGCSASYTAIGKQSTGSNLVGTVELKRDGGAPGYSLSAGGEVQSAWTDFPVSVGDVLGIKLISSSSGQSRTSGDFAGGAYYAASGASYSFTTRYFGAFKIEVRS